MKTRRLCLPVSILRAVNSLSSCQWSASLRNPVAIGAIGLLAFTSVSQAATKTWDGGGANANWTTGGNWDADTAPAALDTLVFDNATRSTAFNNFAANTQFNGITFGSGGTGDWAITGNAINLGGAVTNNRTFGTSTINLNLALLQTTTFTDANANGTLVVAGMISGAGFGLNKAGAGPMVFSGANTYTGPTAIQAGTLKVGTLNSVAGGTASSNLGAPTTVADGTIGIGATAAGSLVYTGAGETTDRVINLAGTTFGVTLDQSGSGLLKFTSNLTATGAGSKTLTLQGSTAGTGEISGIIADNSGVNKTSLTKQGTGTWTLSGASVNTYTGTTAVNRGTLALDYANLATPTDLINSGSVLNLGGGTLALKGKTGGVTTSQTFASTTINPGGSSITVNSNSGTATNVVLGAITRNAGGTVDYTLPAAGSITTTTANANFAGGQQTILDGATVGGNTWAVSGSGATPGAISGLATYNSGFAAGTDVDVATGASAPASMTVNSVRFNGAGAADVTLGGAATVATGGILVTSNVGNNAVSISGSTLASGNGKDLTVIQNNAAGANSTLTVGSQITGTTGLAKSGAGTLVLTGANTYTGVTNLNGGTVNLGIAEAAGTSGPLGAQVATAASTILFNGGTLQFSAANTNDYSGRFGTGANQAISIDTNGQNVTFATASGLASAGGTLTKSGLGTLILPTNTYTGSTTINGGTLQMNGNSTSSNIVNNAALVFFTNANTYAGVISGSGTVTRNATNTNALSLFGANTYTGATSVNIGILGINSLNSVVGGTASSSLGAPTTVANGTIKMGAGNTAANSVATLRYFGDGETTDRVIDLAGTIGAVVFDRNPAGSGLWKFTSDFTATGAGAKTLRLTGGNLAEIAGAIPDNSAVNNTSVQKQSTGTWTLSGNSTYSGTTAIENGILSVKSLNSVVGGTASSSLGAPTTVANGTIGMGLGGNATLLYTGSGETTDRVINLAGTTGGAILDQSGTGLLKFSSSLTATGAGLKTLTLQGSTTGTGEIAGAIVNSTVATSLTKLGTGTWTLSGINTYTGATTVSAGTLATSGTGTLGFSNITIADGAILTLNSAVSIGDANTLTFGPTSVINMNFTGSDTLASITRTGTGGSTFATPGTYTAAQLNNEFGVGTWFSSTNGGTFTIVPEPGTALLGGLGLLTLFRRRRA